MLKIIRPVRTINLNFYLPADRAIYEYVTGLRCKERYQLYRNMDSFLDISRTINEFEIQLSTALQVVERKTMRIRLNIEKTPFLFDFWHSSEKNLKSTRFKQLMRVVTKNRRIL